MVLLREPPRVDLSMVGLFDTDRAPVLPGDPPLQATE